MTVKHTHMQAKKKKKKSKQTGRLNSKECRDSQAHTENQCRECMAWKQRTHSTRRQSTYVYIHMTQLDESYAEAALAAGGQSRTGG